jgi:hypothetical protein
METIYDWLLHNTENAGNYYTILNSQHKTTPEEANYIDVMARDKEYSIVNLLIHYLPTGESNEIRADHLHARTQQAVYSFQSEQEVIEYLSEGKIPELADRGTNPQLQITVLEPAGKSGTITFPPVD